MPLVEYWNRHIYSTKYLPEYLDYLSLIGFDTSNISKKEKFLFLEKYFNETSNIIFWGIFNLLNISVHYDCETGVWPNPYGELIQKYIDICSNDIKGYYPIFEYKKIDNNYKTKYSLIITNGKKAFLTEPNDYGDWYDPLSVENLLNRVLKEEGINKRFIQIVTGDQTILSVYCYPGQLKLLSNKYNIKILHEQKNYNK